MSLNLPVLIVGAGPAGLMMAGELGRFNIPCRIIDKKPESTQGSNATWIQTRTLEIFDAIGIADQFVRIGHRCEAINFYADGEMQSSLPLDQLDSCYPFILMLPQSKTETLLNKRLIDFNIKVERLVELIDIETTNDGVISTLKLADGSIEKVTSNYLIACDGATSKIREKCHIPFSGKDIQEQFMVADARMMSFLPTNEIHVFFDKGTIFPDKGTIFSAFPWGEKNYRLSANLYSGHPRQIFTEHEVKEIVAERTYGNYVVEKVSWVSPFWIHSRIVDQMQQQSIFLVGDAAHIHSPASGQGMNTGLQDAYNLAWKLALVIQNKSDAGLLETYHAERYPVISHVVQQSEYLTNLVLFDKKFPSYLRKFSKNIANNKNVKKISMSLTQLDLKYENSSIIEATTEKLKNSPQPGERASDVIFDESKHLYRYFSSTQHNILLFTGINIAENKLKELLLLKEKLTIKFENVIKILLISSEIVPEISNVILDVNNSIHQQYDLKSQAIYVLRPDQYIAYFSSKPELDLIENFLKKYLK